MTTAAAPTWLVALCAATLAVAMVLARKWWPLNCFTRQPKYYSEEYADDEHDPLLPQLSPIVYCYSGRAPDFDGLLHALARARSSCEVNDVLPGPALEWMFTSDAKALQFVALCQGHIDFSALTVNNLASLVVGLHQFASHEPVAQFICDCFRGKATSDLLRLKHEIEKRVPVYDVLYKQIQSKLIRECILTHLEMQARILQATAGFESPVKLLSLIEDAVFAVEKDTRYPDLTVYPGVQQFAKEVLASRGFQGRGSRRSLDTRDQRQVFFTERAEIWRQRAQDELAMSGFTQYTLMTGTIVDMLGRADAAFRHKLQMISQYKRVFGECDFVFVGQNGQHDVAFGQELLRHPQLYSISVVLIHDVLRGVKPQLSLPDDDETAIRFFRTYVGAAFQLCQLGLLSLDAAVRVARAASTAFRAIPFERSDQQEEAAREFAEEVVDVLMALTPKEADTLAALMPQAVIRFLADRLPEADQEEDDEEAEAEDLIV